MQNLVRIDVEQGDRAVLVDRSLTAQHVADALRAERGAGDVPLFADVYPSFAVAFSRYC